MRTQSFLEGLCLLRIVICRASLTSSDVISRHYTDMAADVFNGKYSQSMLSFRSINWENSICLTRFLWRHCFLRNEITIFMLTIVERTPPYSPGFPNCELCLCKKRYILQEAALSINKKYDLSSEISISGKFHDTEHRQTKHSSLALGATLHYLQVIAYVRRLSFESAQACK